MPSTLSAVVFFFLLAAPGLIADMLRSKRVEHREDESTFREIGRIVLASTAYVSVATLLVLVVAVATPYLTWSDLVRDFELRVMKGHFDLPVLLGGVLIVGLACLLAWLLHRWLLSRWSKRGKAKDVSFESATAWDQIFRLRVPKDHGALVRVTTESGTYQGPLYSYTQANKVDDRELILQAPISFETDKGPRSVHTSWALMAFRADQVMSLSVAMVHKEDLGDAKFLRGIPWLGVEDEPDLSNPSNRF